MEKGLTLKHEIDLLVESTRSSKLTPGGLVELQSNISALKYTLSTYLTQAEAEMLRAKDRYEIHCIKERLKLQALHTKMSSTKANDEVEADPLTEAIRMKYIESKINYSAIKNAMDSSKDVLVSLSMRIKMAEQEAIESRFQ